MLTKKLILLLLAITSFSGFSQSFKTMTITKKDNTKIEVQAIFSYNTDNFIENIIIENNNDSTKTNYDFNDIIEVQKNNDIYVPKTVNQKKYLLNQIIKGSLSLYKNKENYFLENGEYGLKKAPYNLKDELKLSTLKYGTISLFVNKCKEAAKQAYNNQSSLTISSLRRIISTYNSCEIGNDIVIPDGITEIANTPNEGIDFAISVGHSMLKTDFSEISKNTTDNISMQSIGAKLYFNSNMLNEKLIFHFSGDYYFGKEKRISSNLYSKTSFFSIMGGFNYSFGSINKTFKPYIGAEGGMYFNQKSYVIVKPNIIGAKNLVYKTHNGAAYVISGGTYIYLFNQKLDFSIRYQPKLDFKLSTSDQNNRDRSYSITGINFKLSYLF